jgi:hypothetical protein
MWWNNRRSIEDLLGKTLTKIEYNDRDELFFYTTDGQEYMMYHEQDCCESVYLADSLWGRPRRFSRFPNYNG